MKTKLPLWIFLAGLLLALTSAAWGQGTAQGTIALAKVQGEVTLTDKATKLSKSATGVKSITQGWIVTTGITGSVVLVFSNGSTINLGKDSSLDIETYLQDPLADDVKVADLTDEPNTSTTKLNLTHGELVGNVKKLHTDRGSSFNIETPVGAAGIRGTTFRIVFRPDPLNPNRVTFTVSTLEGEVLVSTVTSGTTGAGTKADTVVGTNKEVSVDVEVRIDPVTKTITLVTPIPTPVALDLTNVSQAAITTATQEAVQAAEKATFAKPVEGSGKSTGDSTTNQGGGSDNKQGDSNGSSKSQSQKDTTSGDGTG